MNNENPELRLAEEFVHHTGCHLFLTGKAGTGKTTFLHKIRKGTAKRLVVTAPTGVAAINAGGVTLHSFFQLPFGPFVPGTNPFAMGQHRLRREKINIIQSLDLLVIDEISMVRADLLDLIDLVLRRYRRFDIPFGGVQLLMIGDLHQLPPVVKDADWQILRPHYASPYFFSSLALRESELVTIELRHIYRQSDPHFIDLLNRVRDNRLDASALQRLNERYIENFRPDDDKGYITLSTHNQSTERLNATKLAELPGTGRSFNAELDGEFPEQIYPTAASLELKVGAQVMFVKNDPSPEKRYFNGKIGKVVAISANRVEVRCPDDRDTIEVERSNWENIEYTVDKETAEISQNTIGTFAQFPLKLAWAITIHKSQGLTFDRAVIDAQAAFAHGQVYVALSRCRTLEGMVLSSPINAAAIKTDRTVNQFLRHSLEDQADDTRLHRARVRYQQQLLTSCFDFGALRGKLGRLVSLVERHQSVIQLSGVSDLAAIRQRVFTEICAVGPNFQRQLHALFSETCEPAEDTTILERLAKAAAYFQEKFNELLVPLADMQIETDNKEVRKQFTKSFKALGEEVTVTLAGISACNGQFTPAAYLRALSTAEMKDPPRPAKPPAVTYREEDVGHPKFFEQLKNWRKETAARKNLPLFQIMHQKTLIQIAVHLPHSMAALKGIHGIGPKLAAEYGEELLTLARDYRRENGIDTVQLPDAPLLSVAHTQRKENRPEEKAADSKLTTLTLFQEGKDITRIAKERDLTTGTVERHLAWAVEQNKIAIEALVTESERQLIESIVAKQPDQTMREIRDKTDNRVSWADIRFVLSHLNRTTNTAGSR